MNTFSELSLSLITAYIALHANKFPTIDDFSTQIFN